MREHSALRLFGFDVARRPARDSVHRQGVNDSAQIAPGGLQRVDVGMQLRGGILSELPAL